MRQQGWECIRTEAVLHSLLCSYPEGIRATGDDQTRVCVSVKKGLERSCDTVNVVHRAW